MLNKEKLKELLSENKLLELEKFISKYLQDPNVIGMLLTGSHVHGDAGKNADLDLFIVLKDSKTRERGNIISNGVEIEFFINPVKQIEQYYESEYPNKINTAHMFANGIKIFEKGSDLQRLINLAHFYIEKELPNISDYEIYSYRYILDDYRKDLLDTVEINDSITFELLSGSFIKEAITILGKIKKFYPTKAKRLMKQLEMEDKIFKTKLEGYLNCKTALGTRFLFINECINHLESLLGGPRPDDFSFKSNVVY